MSFPWIPLSRRGQASRRNVGQASERALKTRRRAVLETLEDRVVMSTTIPIVANTWTPIGPAPINASGVVTDTGGFNYTGRVTSIATNPTPGSKVIYIGTAGGGVWESANAGKTWTPLLDNGPTSIDGLPTTVGSANLPTGEIGAVAVAPSKPAFVYAGTGDPNNAADSYAGVGILSSQDGGATWALATDNGAFKGLSTAKIVVDPNNQNIVYAAMTNPGVTSSAPGVTGIYRSTDGGVSWSNLTASISPTADYTDIVFDPSDPNFQTLYMAIGSPTGDQANGVYKTTDGGQTWNLVTGLLPSGPSDGRIALAISTTTTPVTLYAVIAGSGQGGTTYGSLDKLMKSTDGGTTWTDETINLNFLEPFGFFLVDRGGWYDISIAVDPTNANNVFVGGTNLDGFNGAGLVESQNGGASWFNIGTDVAGHSPHGDSHAMAFDQTGKLLEGDDGGIFRLQDPNQATLTWNDLNANLQITDITSLALAPGNANLAYAGTTGTGTIEFNGTTTWTEIRGSSGFESAGDTGEVAVSPTNSQVVYREVARYPNDDNFSGLEVSNDGGKTWSNISPFDFSDNRGAFEPFAIDPTNAKRILFGSDQLYESLNSGTSYSFPPIGSPTKAGFNPNSLPIDALAIAPSQRNTIYVTAGGQVFVTQTDGKTWLQRDVQGATDHFSAITVDRSNSQIAYITRNQYDDQGNQGHVFMTTNGGRSWTDISQHLPDVPVLSIAQVNVLGIKELFVGTSEGVYFTSDLGATWSPFGMGLPNTPITSLVYDPGTNILAAGTHGRGAFEILGNVLLQGSGSSLTDAIEGNNYTASLATFVDTAGADPVGNYSATINWGDGTAPTTGTITGSSVFTVMGSHTYALPGTYTVSISLTDTDGAIGQVNNTVVVDDAPIVASPPAVTPAPVEGLPFSGVISTFTYGDPGDQTLDFTTGNANVTINWGDGNTSPGTIVYDPSTGLYSISSSNTYLEEGTYTVTVSITDTFGGNTTETVPVTVSDAPLTPVPVGATAIEGLPFANQTVADFTDADPNGAAVDYIATINWGDNTLPQPGLIGVGGGGVFTVSGSHQYNTVGTYNLTITVRDTGGAPPIIIKSTETVVDAPLTATGTTISSQEEQPIATNTIVGSFSDAFTGAPLSDFTATINWGDGITTNAPGTIVPLGNGKFVVEGGYTYAEEGNYTVTVSIKDSGGSTAQAQTFVVVADAPLFATPVNFTAVEGQTLTNKVVATFTDADQFAPLSDYSATIDWGDGNGPQAAQVIPLGGGNFQVAGSVTYKLGQPYTVKVAINDVGGSTAQAVANGTITDAPLVAGAPFSVQATVGVPFTGAAATFEDTNPFGTSANFLASVDWGDGTTSNATVTQTGTDPVTGSAIFTVSPITGGHTYNVVTAPNQPFTITATVIDLGGARLNLNGSATVADAPVTVTSAGLIQTVEGALFSGVVADFTDADTSFPASNFTATIDWGDGHTTPGLIAFDAVNLLFTVSGTNTYSEEGTYSVHVTVNSQGGAVGAQPTPTPVIVADATLLAGSAGITAIAGLPFNGVVAGFTDTDPNAPGTDYTATINWGDGTVTAGAITQPGGPGTLRLVSGAHTFSNPSESSPFSVTIHDKGGAQTTTSVNSRVLVPLTGTLDAASDSGVSNADGITNVIQPHFFGTGEPGEEIELFATPLGQSAPIALGQNVVSTQGTWSIVSAPLGNGAYTVFANSVNTNTNGIDQSISILPSANRAPLVIDTAGPAVSLVVFNPVARNLQITLQSGPAGLNTASLYNPANFQFAVPKGSGLLNLPVTGFTVNQTSPFQATIDLSYNFGKRVKPGVYVLTVFANSVIDRAGNTLVEKNLVAFPQTTNSPNPNFIGEIDLAKNGSVSGIHQYISAAERAAANRFASGVHGQNTVRIRRR